LLVLVLLLRVVLLVLLLVVLVVLLVVLLLSICTYTYVDVCLTPDITTPINRCTRYLLVHVLFGAHASSRPNACRAVRQ
jgi:hypothetical protein